MVDGHWAELDAERGGPGEWDGNQNEGGEQGWWRRDGLWGRAGVRKGQGL